MKKYFLGAAAAIALVAPGVASAETTAEVGLSIGNVDFDGGGDADLLGLNGAFSHETGNGLTLQVDGGHTRIDAGPEFGVGHVSASLGMRNDSYAFYGFVGMGDVAALSSTNLGVGGQLFLDRFTLNGSYGHAEIDTANIDVDSLHIDGTYFFTDNFGLSGELGSAELDAGGGMDWTTYGIGAVYRFAGSPIAINGGYRVQDFDGGGEADTFRIGFTYNIGTSSEIERSRRGASFGGARDLADAVNVVLY